MLGRLSKIYNFLFATSGERLMYLGWYVPQIGFATSASNAPPAVASEPLMSSWNATGAFWLPERPERECWGTVSFVPGGGIEATLDQNLFVTGRVGPMLRKLPVIHGRLSNGTLCSLFSWNAPLKLTCRSERLTARKFTLSFL